MKSHFIDLRCPGEGRWEIRRADPNVSIDDIPFIPLEVCPDGSWCVSGIPRQRFEKAFDPAIRDDKSLFSDINEMLGLLRAAGVLHNEMIPAEQIARLNVDHHAPLFDRILHVIELARTPLMTRIDTAPATSLAGILRERGEQDAALRFLRGCGRSDLKAAFAPLYQETETTPGGVAFGYVVSTDSCRDSSPLFPFHFHCVHVDAKGAMFVREARHDSLSEVISILQNYDPRNARLVQLESCNLRHADVCCELSELQGNTTRMIRRMARSGKEWNLPEEVELRRWVERMVQQQLADSIEQMRKAVAERVYPFDGTLRDASFSQYFAGVPIDEVRLRRQQALNVMPLLASALARGELPGTAKAVDEALPVLDALAAELHVPYWAALRLSRLKDGGEYFYRKDIVRQARVIDGLGADCARTRSDCWHELNRLARTLDTDRHYNIGWRMFGHAEQDARLLLRALGKERNGQGTHDSWGNSALESLTSTSASIGLYWCVARQSIVRHLHLHGKAASDTEVILAKWLEKQTVTDVLRNSKRVSRLWWQSGEEMPSWLRDALSESVQPSIEAHACAETGTLVRPLCSRRDVEQEGRSMRHCVGRYWGIVATRQVQLFSLCDTSTGTQATLSVSDEGGSIWCISEFKGERNAEVRSPALVRAAELLCERLGSLPSCQFDVIPDKAGTVARRAALVLPDSGFAMQSLCSDMLEAMLACYPGGGTLERRIEAVRTKLARKSKRHP